MNKSRYPRQPLKVAKAKLVDQPLPTVKGTSPSQKAGYRFEKKVQYWLLEHYDGNLLVSPWFKATLHDGHVMYIEVDALLIDPLEGVVTIIECKLSHTTKAYYQMYNKYRSILRIAFPGYSFRGVEVFKNYASIPYPVDVKLVHDLDYKWDGFGNIMRFDDE